MPEKWTFSVQIITVIASIILNINGFCIFDDVKLQNPLKLKSKDSLGTNPGHLQRDKRNVPSADDFKPIRIEVYSCGSSESHHGFGLSKEEKLQTTVRKAVRKAEQILSVVPHEGVLLLSRSKEACADTYINTTNAGKCANVRRPIKRESCLDIQIPQEHLEGLVTYGPDDPNDITVHEHPGSGVLNKDFILYIQSSATTKCLEPNVQAYASQCQLAENNRPIAGYINMCPSLFSDETFDEHQVSLIALHELFHALGFSKEMFGKFQQCNSQSCMERSEGNTVSNTAMAKRLITPIVVETTSSHFNCTRHVSSNDFGPILEISNTTKEVKSHWDGAFMYSSIMAPTIALPYETVIDNITLAFFEDTGWYKVDYSHAQNFPWGRGGGCDWGLQPHCISKDMVGDCFCAEEEEQGCHYLRKSKGTCRTDVFLHECMTYKSVRKDSCLFAENSPEREMIVVTGERYRHNSRCFLANLSINADGRTSKLGRCYETRCNGSDVEVRVGQSPWTLCPYGQSIDVEGYHGTLDCPAEEILCTRDDRTLPDWLRDITTTSTTLPSTSTTIRPTYAEEEQTTTVVVEIHFQSPDFSYLQSTDKIGYFINECEAEVVRSGGLASRRVQNPDLRRGSIIFSFDLLPAQYSGDGPPTQIVIKKLKEMVDKNDFRISLPGDDTDSYTANRLLTFDVSTVDSSGPALSDNGTPTEVIIGVVVGSVIAAVLIGVAVYFVQRFYAIQSLRNAQRSAQNETPQRSSAGDADSRHSSQSRASGRSCPILRTSGSNSAISMMGSVVDLDSEAPPPYQSHQSPINSLPATPTNEEKPAIDSTPPSSDYIPSILKTPDISFDPSSEITPESSRSSKQGSRQRTPVTGGRKSRRSSVTQSTNSRASSNDRQAPSYTQSTISRTSSGDRQATISSSSSTQGRRRSRSRTRSVLKTRENSPYAQVRKNPSRRSHSTRSTEKPRVRIREDFNGYAKRPYDDDDATYRGCYSPKPPRAIISKSHQQPQQKPYRNDSQTGGIRPRLRNPRPREMRRKTTNCVFSPRDLEFGPAPEKIISKPIEIDINLGNINNDDSSSKETNVNNDAANSIKNQMNISYSNKSKNPTVSKCIDVDTTISSTLQNQESPCPLQCPNNKRYESTTCPLQTPNCSKENIKDSDLPPVINPRDSDLSFTLDMKDFEMSDSLSVYNAPRPEKLQKINNALSAHNLAQQKQIVTSPVAPQPTPPELQNLPPLLPHANNYRLPDQPPGYRLPEQPPSYLISTQPPKQPATVYSDHSNLNPSSQSQSNNHKTVDSCYQNSKPLGKPPIYNNSVNASRKSPAVKIFNPPVPEQYAPPPVVEHLEQLPLVVPIIKLSAQDVDALNRISGSWRSFSSDTSLDSLSSPV